MIDKSYVLMTRIPLIKGEDGRYFTDPLWAKDLRQHFTYLRNFRICCPVVPAKHDNDTGYLEEIAELNFGKVVVLSKDKGWLSVARNILPNFVRVIRACRSAEIVHSSGAGWAFPLSFYVFLLRPFIAFKWLMVIESSFWKLNDGERFNMRRFTTHHIHKFLLTRCVRSADARLFTHSGYKKLFLVDQENAMIAPATWIDAANILTPEIVKERIASRKMSDKRLKLIFPSRLTEGKGVLVVLEAAKILREMGAQADLTIIGEGPLEDLCIEAAAIQNESFGVVFRKPVEYGNTFFRLLSENDAVLAPSLSEEQPRIIFDAFCQGIPVIASDTDGNRDVTAEGKNAILFKAGAPKALVDAIVDMLNSPETAGELGLSGLKYVHDKTHTNMHIEREKYLKKTLVC